MSKTSSIARHLSGWASLALAAGLVQGSESVAQVGAQVADPPVLGPVDAPAATAWRTFAPLAATEQALDLTIDYSPGTIFNPATNRRDKVRLRSYIEAGEPHNGLFISPAIHTRPGQTIRVNLHNRLPADPTCATADHGGDVNVPHCFNGTNLHTHGLWVNPSGNGDNVLLSINPGVDFEYEYPIPPDHPAGTFWYHTHRHGSTAMQVSSGMAGALIIHGDRLPTAGKPGDLDTLLADVPEHVLVFQQIQYYCRNGGGAITYDCGPDQVGEIESYDALRTGWGRTGRYTSINGLVLPDFEAEQGKLQRWRMIHGGVRDTIGLQFRRARDVPLKPGPKLAADRMGMAVDKDCQGEILPFHLVASDGITMPAALRKDVAVFQPGYRFDALVAFPEAGSYCVIDVNSGASSSVGGVPSGTRLLGMVRVKAGSGAGEAFTAQLVAAAERTMPAGVRGEVVADLRNGLRLSRFVPHPTVADSEVQGREKQELTFSGLKVGGKGYAPRSYDPARLDRRLELGSAQEWDLKGSGHPFHIHVNPFQVVEVLDEDGNDVSAPDGPGDPNSQYRGLKGAWKDTLWVEDGHRLKVRTRYERYIGEFVLHCHILDHEDKGMMQNVAIVLPGGTPESVNAPPEDHGGH